MIASGSSERGLSEVTTQASASRAAIPPISGRFSRSRSPPQPKTAISRPVGQLARRAQRRSPASRGCARSRPGPRTAGPRRPARSVPGTRPASASAAAAASRRHAERVAGRRRAPSAFSTLKWPGSGVRTATSPPGPRQRNRDPAASKETSSARKSAASRAARREGDQRRVDRLPQLGRQPGTVGIVHVDHRGRRAPSRRTARAWPRSSPPCRAWKSRWSWVRLVNTATANRIAGRALAAPARARRPPSRRPRRPPRACGGRSPGGRSPPASCAPPPPRPRRRPA